MYGDLSHCNNDPGGGGCQDILLFWGWFFSLHLDLFHEKSFWNSYHLKMHKNIVNVTFLIFSNIMEPFHILYFLAFHNKMDALKVNFIISYKPSGHSLL